MNTNGRVRDKEPNVATSFSELTHDVIELAELQAQLLALDIKSTGQKTRISFFLIVLGTCLLLGSITEGLIAFAQFLIEELNWSRDAGFAVAALMGVALGMTFLSQDTSNSPRGWAPCNDRARN